MGGGGSCNSVAFVIEHRLAISVMRWMNLK